MRYVSLAMLLVMPFAAQAGQVLVNGDFESGVLTPWYNANDLCSGCLWSATNLDARTGTYSATVDGNRELEQDFAAVLNSDITEVSFWAHFPVSSQFLASGLEVDFFYSDSTTSNTVVTALSTDWEHFDVTSALATGKSLVGLAIYGNSGLSVAVDDASIVTGTSTAPEPSSLALFAGGFMALATGLRRRAR